MITNPNKLIEKLESLPNDIYEQEKKVIDAKEALEEAKLTLEVATAKHLLEAEKPNATEKKAYATIKTEPYKKTLIEAQMKVDRQTAYLEALNNKFIALRKISSIEERLMGANLSGN